MARSSKADVRRTLTRRWSGTRLAALWSPSSPCHSDRRRPSGTASSLLTAISSSWSTGSTCSDTSEPRYRVQGRARHRSGWTRYAGRGPRPPTPPGQHLPLQGDDSNLNQLTSGDRDLAIEDPATVRPVLPPRHAVRLRVSPPRLRENFAKRVKRGGRCRGCGCAAPASTAPRGGHHNRPSSRDQRPLATHG